MRELGIEGISRRRKKVFTTVADPDATRAPEPVNRQFVADRPDALWVTRPDLRADPIEDGVRVLHHRRVLPAHRGLAGGGEHDDRHGPRRPQDARRSRGGRRLVPHAEFEAAFYAAQPAEPARVGKPLARVSIRARAVHCETP